MAAVDLYSRKVISWSLSNRMDTDFCCRDLQEALQTATPQIVNTDQGSHGVGRRFTRDAFAAILKKNNIQSSMDSKGRAIDNIFVERLWRSVNRVAGR